MKKLNKFFAVLVALAMMATLCVSMSLAATTPTATGDQIAALADAKLVKYLKIDEGVTIPNEDFRFEFEQKESDTIKTADFVTIPAQTLNARTDLSASGSNKDDGALVGYLDLSSFINKNMFDKAGEYVYTVKEVKPSEQDPEGTDTTGMTYSEQTYTLRIYVAYKDGELDVDKVTVENNDQKNGEGEEATTGTKTDPTDPDPSDGDDDQPGTTDDKEQSQITDANVEGFTYINEYKLPDDENPALTNDYGAFYATKAITGTYGVKQQKFPVTISVEFPTTYANGDKALNLYDKNGDAIANAVLADTATAPATSLVWATTVELADGDIAYFKNLPAGAKVTVSEDLTASTINNAAYYNQTTEAKQGGTVVDHTDTMYDGEDQAVATKTKDTPKLTKITAAEVEYLEANAVGTADSTAVTGKKATSNNAKVTNDNVYDPGATGILLSNLPYIVLALVAIGGMVAYVVIRRRQSDEA